ncbi:hypothetical protein JCM10207_008645 [Rhodosporidiobolus poonsookiae]
MLPVADDHPLSPPLHTAHSSAPLFPDIRPSLARSPRSAIDAPLFPASPPIESAVAAVKMSRTGSAATLFGRDGTGIGLGLPTALHQGETDEVDDSAQRQIRRASAFSSRPLAPSSPPLDDPPIPPLLSLPSAPHLLPSTSTLLDLPSTHLAALAQSLSRDLATANTLLRMRDAELAALERLAEANGAGRGEIDRAKVRVRAEVNDQTGDVSSDDESRAVEGDKVRAKSKSRKGKEREQGEWTIEVGEFATPEAEDASNEGTSTARHAEEETVPPKTEVDLDLDDLTEAISSNAFDLGLQPASSSPHPSSSPIPLDGQDDASSMRSRALSLPVDPSARADDASETASIASTSLSAPSSSAPPVSAPIASIKPKSARTRHPSLSTRLFNSIVGAPASTSSRSEAKPPASPTTSSTPSLATSPPSTNPALVPLPPTPQKLGDSGVEAKAGGKGRPRSGSVKSTRSVRSVSSTTSGTGGGYGDWLWKAAGGWGGKGRAESILETSSEAGEEAQEPGQVGVQEQIASNGRKTDEDGDSTGSGTSRRASTATVNTAPSTLATTIADPSTPERVRSPSSLASSTRSPSSPTLSRSRSPLPPPALLSASVNGSLGTAEAVLSTPLAGGTMSTSAPPSRRGSATAASPTSGLSPSSRSIALPSLPDEMMPEEGELEEDEGTIKRPAAGLAPPVDIVPSAVDPDRPTFVPGVPLYSASDPPSPSSSPTDAITRLASQHQSASKDKGGGGYAATLSRALGLSSPSSSSASSTSSVPGALAPPASSSPPPEPNLTLFPRLPSLSLSRNSLFAQPTLSTPATHVSLTSGGTAPSLPSSPLVPHTAVLAAPSSSNAVSSKGTMSGASLTLELSTLSSEAAPPSLALLKPSYTMAAAAGAEVPGEADEGEGEGPMIDRYGFIYDVRQGMELLKSSREREKRRGGEGGKKGRAKDVVVLEQTIDLPSPSAQQALLTPPTELEVHPQLDALREAIGLTPTVEESSALSPPLDTVAPPPTSTTSSATLTRVPSSPPPPLSRSVAAAAARDRNNSPSPAPSHHSSSTTNTTSGTGPQSMRALLAQLRTMTDAVEKTQQEAWDIFIRRRQAKLAKLKRREREEAAEAATKGKGKSKRKPGGDERERPKTLFLAQGEEMDVQDGEGEEVWTSENLVGVAQMGTEGKGKKEDWAEFKELVRKGVPIAYRPKIWGECSSANEAREPGVYQELLAQPETEAEMQCLKQIDMDCHRTFPTNVFFAGNGPGVAKLRNVLVAYSRRNPKIGYCQGMNNLVATLLLTHPTEEDAFWVLVCIVENILPSDYYTSHLLVSRADQYVLRDLVARILPTIADHLDEHGVELSAITFGWFLSLFTDVLPIQTLLRVWDLFFIHGTVLLFRVALAVLKLHEADLVACDSAAALYGLLGTLPGHVYHADRLLKVACEDLVTAVKDREVSILRSKHVAALQAEMGLAADDDDGQV